MSHHPVITAMKFSVVRKQMLTFSLLGLVLLVLLLALFEPRGIDSATTTAQDLLSRARTTSTDIGWSMVPAMIGAGVAAGFLAGMLGMGGGVLKITCMLLLFNLDIFFVRAISLVTMFCSSSSALWHHLKQRTILWPLTRPMLVLSIPGAVLGALLGNSLKGAILVHLFGFFVIFLAFNTLALAFGDPKERLMKEARQNNIKGEHPSADPGYISAVIGALHGVVCGLLGVSGGVIATPMQQILLHVPMRNAIANTLVVSTVVTAVASALVLWTGVDRGDFLLSQVIFVDLFIGGGATIGAPLGVRLGKDCNITVMRLIFVVLTLGAGLSIIF